MVSHRFMVRFFGCTLILIAAGRASAQAVPPATAPALNSKAGTLDLRTGPIDLRARPSLHTRENHVFDGKRVVLQLDGPIDPARRAALQNAGVRLGAYLPANAYIAKLDGVRSDALAALVFVAWVGPVEAAWKIAPGIGAAPAGDDERRELAAAGKLRVAVALFEDGDVQATAQSIAALGGIVRSVQPGGSMPRLEADIPQAGLQQLAAIEDVMFVDETDEIAPRNSTATWIGQSNTLNFTPFWDLGLDGTGEIVGVIDWFLKTDHCSFVDAVNPIGPLHRKIHAYYNQGPGGGSFDYHGTIVNGVFLGHAPGEANPDYKGMAYNARVVFQHVGYSPNLFVTATNVGQRLLVAHNDGARVHNNSWGGTFTTYTARSRDVDEFMRNNEDDLVVNATLNSGSIGNPDNAKNCLTVSAAGDTPNQGNFCDGAPGPTADGRRKPDVMAVGCGVITAANTPGPCDLTAATFGTSYATPSASGMAVIARQYFMNGFYPTGAANPSHAFTPSGALLKAILVNSATDMTGMVGYPGNQEGWGRILLDDALYRSSDARKTIVQDLRNASGLSTGQSGSYPIVVLGNAQPLKITLVWTDMPAAINANPTPINNLDLTVTDPAANVYRGNVFSAGQSATGGVADTLNNVEQVHRLTPLTGTYTVQVSGTAVNQSTQGYALVVTGEVLNCGFVAKGDVNLDSVINGADVNAFIQTVLPFAGTVDTAAECAADVGSAADACVPDNMVTVDDVAGFAAILLDGTCP